jgi:hypothetical protein
MLGIVMGLLMIVGGLSGKLVFRGTGSGALLAVFGLFVLARGVMRWRSR